MSETKDLISAAGKRARELFESKQYNCAEASFLALNEVFCGGIEPQTAARIATGLGGGLGASGGTCGALTGCVLAIGLIADSDPEHLRKKTVYPLASVLQERFQKQFGSCCCRDLIRDKGDERRAYCRGITSVAATLCAEILIENTNKEIE